MKKIKRILSAVTALAVMAGFTWDVPSGYTDSYVSAYVQSETFVYGDLSYISVDDDEDGTYDYVAITDCDTSATEVEIPSGIDGLPVIIISNSAFRYCSSLTSITIPESVMFIGYDAFYDCDALTSITIPDSVIDIGESAFFGCDGLTDITIPDSVMSIGYDAFAYCRGLTSINVAENNENYTSTDGVLFNKAQTELIHYPIGNERTEYIIPDSVTSIGNGVFMGCSSLTSINVAESNEYYSSTDGVLFNKAQTELIQYPIGNERTKYIIPDSVTSIGEYAFFDCSSLTSITIPDSVTSIEDGVFSSCYSLTDITIPDSVTSIEACAFLGCYGLTSITIPDSVISIGDYAFGFCYGLTSITIENSECEIYDSEYTISNGSDESYSSYFNGTIYGNENSTAQAYAEKYGYNFEVLDEEPVQTTPAETTLTSSTETSTIITTSVSSVDSVSVEDFLNSGYNNSRFTVYDGTNAEESFQMMGESFSQGLVGNVENYNFNVLDAEISFNVKNIDNIIFTLGHVDNTNQKNMTLYIYMDNELQRTLECEPSMNTTCYKLDTSKATSLRFYMDGENATSYALANIVINEDFSSVPSGSYNTDEIISLGVFYEPTETTAPVQLPDDGAVYNGHTYKVIVDESITTWKDAQAYCQSLGGHLATISDSNENSFIYGLIKKETDVSRFRLGGYYTSLTDSWAWVDGTEFSYTNWSADQPDNYENTQFCLTMLNQDIYDGTELLAGMWDDDYNYYADASYGFVCEWDEAPASIKGDANNDGKVNVRDAAFIAAALAKGQADTLPEHADFSGDGKVNVRDAAAIASWLAKGGK